MPKTLVVMHDRNHVKYLSSKIEEELEQHGNEVVVVTVGFSLKESMFARKILCHEFSKYKPVDSDVQSRVQAWIKKWSDKKIVEGRNLKEILGYNGVSLWWFIEFHYFYRRYMSQISGHIETLQVIINKERPSKLIFVNDRSLFSKVLLVFTQAKNVKTLEIRVDFGKGGIRSRLFKFLIRNHVFFLAIRETLRSKWSTLINALLSKDPSKGRECPTVVVMSTERDWRFILDPYYSNRKGLNWVHPILEFLRGRYRVILISMKQWDYRPGLKTLLEQKLTYPYSIIRTPWSWQNKIVKARVKKARVRLTSTWNVLKESNDFKSSLNYDGIPLWSILREMFWDMFFRVLPEAIRSIEIAKIMVDNEKPISIILPCEYCTNFSYASLIIGQKRRIQTIALQHGIITPHSFEYKFTSNEKRNRGPNSKLSVLPTKFAVYGASTKKVLQRLLYPTARIAVTGSPQYDTLFHFKKLLDRNRILKALNVDPDKRIITLTTQPILTKEVLMRIVLNAVKGLEDVVLVVKPHPAENKKSYADFIEKTKIPNAIVLASDYNTMKALCVCDLVITMFSTTALEAMMLEKPVITINVEEETASPFAKGGPTMNVSTSKELLQAINGVLTNHDLRKSLIDRQNTFLSEQMYGMDGQSSKRATDFIKKGNNRVR
jgi:hypothetical protein